MQTNSRIEKPTRNASARAMLLVLGLPSVAVAHHEEQGRTQAADDGHERQEHEVFHDADYPVTGVRCSAASGWSRWPPSLGIAATLAPGRLAAGPGAAEARAAGGHRAAPGHAAARPADAPGGRAARRICCTARSSCAATGCRSTRCSWTTGRCTASPASTWSRRLQLEGSDAGRAGGARLGPAQFHPARQAAADRHAGRARSSCTAAWPRRPAKLYEFAGRGARRPSGKISTWPRSGPKRSGAAGPVPCSRPARRPKACCASGPRPPAAPPKHYGYAFQWWALSALIAILYVWFQFIAPPPQGPSCLTSRWA